jgi:hypothetical protein
LESPDGGFVIETAAIRSHNRVQENKNFPLKTNLQVDQLDTECICAEEFLSSTLSNIVVLLTDVLERNLASVIRTYLGEGFSITIYNKIIKPKPAGLKTIILTESCFLRNCLIIVQTIAISFH